MFTFKKWKVFSVFIVSLLVLFSYFSEVYSPGREQVFIDLGCGLVPCGDIVDGCRSFEMCQLYCTLGDVNSDHNINILDVVSAVSFATDNTVPTDPELCGADLNFDGFVNVLDIIQIINVIISNFSLHDLTMNPVVSTMKVTINSEKKIKNILKSIFYFPRFEKVYRSDNYQCVESLPCSNSCNNGIDDDNDGLEDWDDPSCSGSQEDDTRDPSPCKNYFNIDTLSGVFAANGDGDCLSEIVGSSHEVCVSRGDGWVAINNFAINPTLSNLNLCLSSDDFCCINTNAEGDETYGNAYDINGSIYVDYVSEWYDFFVYCGDDHCQGWEYIDGVPQGKLNEWYIWGPGDLFFAGENFNSCNWRDENNVVQSDCPFEPFNCLVTNSDESISGYLKPINNFYLSNTTNAHVSITDDYDYRVYCSYMNYQFNNQGVGFDFLRIENDNNSHVELIDQDTSGYEDYKLNTNDECFYVYQESSCPINDNIQTFCVLALSNMSNAHVEDCSFGNYDYKLCCGY